MIPPKNISAADFRMPKEQPVLFISLSILIVLMSSILALNPLILLALIGFSAIVIKVKQKQFLGTSVKVTSNSFPDVQKAAQIASDNLSITLPDIFVAYSPIINAFALGILGKKSIVLHSSLVEAMNEDELIFVIGHELSHIKCGHTSWSVITNSVNQIRVPVISDIMGYIFLFWNRIAEYTADRGGLIACRNLTSSTSALIKLATGEKLSHEVDTEEFINQVNRDGRIAQIAEILLTHPYIVNRVKILANFYDLRIYKNICSRKFDDEQKNNELKALLIRLKDDLSGKDIESKIKILTLKLEKVFQNVERNIRSKANNKAKNSKNYKMKSDSESEKASDGQNPRDNEDTFDQKVTSKDIPNRILVDDKALLSAVVDENLELVMNLLNNKGDPNAVDRYGDTPLLISVGLENYEMAKIILEHGAYIDQPNKKGETPILIAQNNHLTKFSELLKKYRSGIV
jgi:Zn-dependent protease with chaperone function